MINNIRLGYPGENLTTGLRTNRTHLLNDRHPNELIPKCIKDAHKNLRDLLKILEWNESKGIRFYRINSGLFPHISNWRCFFPAQSAGKNEILDFKTLAYNLEQFQDEISAVGAFARANGHRLTFHPLPYTVLNTPSHFTLITVTREIWWHTRFLQMAGLEDGTITLHIGGVYGNKKTAAEAFIKHFNELLPEMKARIIIENDEGDFSIDDLISISGGINPYKYGGYLHKTIPICFDYFHYCCFNINTQRDKCKYPKQSKIEKVLSAIFESWTKFCVASVKRDKKKKDEVSLKFNENTNSFLQTFSSLALCAKEGQKVYVRPKMHLSEQAYRARLGTHSKFIKKIPKILCGLSVDLMLESKNKDKTLLRILKQYHQNNHEVCGK